ncbi:MAG: hypothetical protein JSW65_05825, partial [Candidatus Bipolaricaulota bacterium]
MFARFDARKLTKWIEPGFWAAPFLIAGDTSIAALGIPVRLPYTVAACALALCAVGMVPRARSLGSALWRGRGPMLAMAALGLLLAASLVYSSEFCYGADKAVRFWVFGVLGAALAVALTQ